MDGLLENNGHLKHRCKLKYTAYTQSLGECTACRMVHSHSEPDFSLLFYLFNYFVPSSMHLFLLRPTIVSSSFQSFRRPSSISSTFFPILSLAFLVSLFIPPSFCPSFRLSFCNSLPSCFLLSHSNAYVLSCTVSSCAVPPMLTRSVLFIQHAYIFIHYVWESFRGRGGGSVK